MHPSKWLSRRVAARPGLEKSLVYAAHRWPRSRVVSSLCYHTGEELSRKDPNATRIAALDDGIILSVMLSEGITRGIYFTGVYEPETTALLRRLAQPGQTWLDVGANVGYFTLLLSRLVGPSGYVHAFEPNLQVVDHLDKSLTMNAATNVRVVRDAVSDVSGQTVRFFIPQGEHSNSVRGSVVRFGDISTVREVAVQTISLDDYIERTGAKPDFVKVDVEGLEILVLRGFQRTLAQSPPRAIISELNQFPDVLAKPVEIIEFLERFAYRPFKIRERGLVPWAKGEAVHVQDMNFAFFHDSVPDEAIRPLLI